MSESDSSNRKRAASIASTDDGSVAAPPSATIAAAAFTTATTTGHATNPTTSSSSTSTSTYTTNSKKKQKKGGRGSSHSGGAQTYVPPGVVISRLAEDCAPQLSLSKDQLIITGNKGFRMARATHGASNGTWFWECTILPPETKEGHCRLGWSLPTGSLQGPVGYDKSSYAYRDIAGSKVHESLRTDNYGEPWGPGDVVGFLIKLKAPTADEIRDANAGTHGAGRLGVSGSAHGAGGLPNDGVAGAGASLVAGEGTNPFNEIRFFKNGRDQGIAFSGIKSGTYFPAVSLYMGGSVRANFGPEFVYPPPSSHRWKSIATLRPLTKEDAKAQRTRTKRERAARGLETATRQIGSAQFSGLSSSPAPTNSSRNGLKKGGNGLSNINSTNTNDGNSAAGTRLPKSTATGGLGSNAEGSEANGRELASPEAAPGPDDKQDTTAAVDEKPSPKKNEGKDVGNDADKDVGNDADKAEDVVGDGAHSADLGGKAASGNPKELSTNNTEAARDKQGSRDDVKIPGLSPRKGKTNSETGASNEKSDGDGRDGSKGKAEGGTAGRGNSESLGREREPTRDRSADVDRRREGLSPMDVEEESNDGGAHAAGINSKAGARAKTNPGRPSTAASYAEDEEQRPGSDASGRGRGSPSSEARHAERQHGNRFDSRREEKSPIYRGER